MDTLQNMRVFVRVVDAGSFTAAAQQIGPAPAIEAGHTLLTLSAEGRTSRKPDLAVFTAGVASSGKTAGEALGANSADMAVTSSGPSSGLRTAPVDGG